LRQSNTTGSFEAAPGVHPAIGAADHGERGISVTVGN